MSQHYHGRCRICAATELKRCPGFCYVHELFRDSSRVQQAADAHAVAEVYAERPAQQERAAVIASEPRSRRQLLADEWCHGDEGGTLLRRVLIDRLKAQLPCHTKELAQYDSRVAAIRELLNGCES